MIAALKLPEVESEGLSFVDEARYREEDDHGSGVVFFRPRYYDPRNGRFTRLDPFSGTMASPLTLHKYAYAHGNPITGIDPTGLFTLTELMAVVNIGAVLTFAMVTPGSSQRTAASQQFNLSILRDEVRRQGLPTGLLGDIGVSTVRWGMAASGQYNPWTNTISLPRYFFGGGKTSGEWILDFSVGVARSDIGIIYNELFHAWFDNVARPGTWYREMFAGLAAREYPGASITEFEEAFSETVDKAVQRLGSGLPLTYSLVAQSELHGGRYDNKRISDTAYRLALWALHNGISRPSGIVDGNLDLNIPILIRATDKYT